jgi:outer membrane receptor protein involved in Fe transport
MASEAPVDTGAIDAPEGRTGIALADVPQAISVLPPGALEDLGIFSLARLQRAVPSLLVSPDWSEAVSTTLRIRGIGTVRANPGLSGSVAVAVDGVERTRPGLLGDFGQVAQVDVLRGPQGTQSGIAATAGVVRIASEAPSFTPLGQFDITAANFGGWRLGGMVTSPLVGDKVATRFDGYWEKRDGLVTDPLTDTSYNDRGRWFLRSQILWEPRADLSIRLIGEVGQQDEQCCASVYLPFRTTVPGPGGPVVLPNNPIATLLRQQGAVLVDDPERRETSVTPGRSYLSQGSGWSLIGKVDWTFALGTLSSTTAWQSSSLTQAQDADYTNLDLLARAGWHESGGTFSQELRLAGTAGPVAWTGGLIFVDENLNFSDDLSFGQQYQPYADALMKRVTPSFPGYAALAASLGRPGDTLNGRGIVADRYERGITRFALFTNNVWTISPSLSLTGGLRWEQAKTSLDAELLSDNSLCGAILASPADAAAAPLACAISGVVLAGDESVSDNGLSGTLVLSWRASEAAMLYASLATGWKPGGFSLDRSGLDPLAPALSQLRYLPETSRSIEVGAKLTAARAWANIALFHERFSNLQLGAFDGAAYVVTNLGSCGRDLGDGNRDFAGLPVNGVPLTPAQAAATGACFDDSQGPAATSRGVEVEAAMAPLKDVSLGLGLTWADVAYDGQLTGTEGAPLSPALFLLPGARPALAPAIVQTGALAWTPQLYKSQTSLKFVLDYRYQSASNGGIDLFPEKEVAGFVVANARAGLVGPDGRWSIELWVENMLDTQPLSVAFNTPLQGRGTAAQVARGGPEATTLFGAFLVDPRRYGVTLRSRF